MLRISDDYSLAAHNTFRVRVKCAKYIEYDNLEDLKSIDFGSLPSPLKHIGQGSNILWTSDFPGTVLHSAVKFIEPLPDSDPLCDKAAPGDVLVRAGSGVIFDDFCAWAASKGYWGAENLSLIPGEVGASAVQNIGAYGTEACNIIRQVNCFEIVTGRSVSFPVEKCAYGYRDSIFKNPPVKDTLIVTDVVFALSRTAGPKLGYGNLRQEAGEGDLTPQKVREAVIRIRQAKLPDVSKTGNAGSFFKNPVVSEEKFRRLCEDLGISEDQVPHYKAVDGIKIPAAWLIEKSGMKGYRHGGAAVYEKQPLVIVSLKEYADPQEVLQVRDEVVARVKALSGIELVPEVEIMTGSR